MSISAISAGNYGIQQGLQKIDNAAGKIAQESVSAMSGKPTSTGYTHPLVEMKQAELQSKASIKVVQAEKEMIGSLLNVIA